jgi:hemerythrin superfamily protein
MMHKEIEVYVDDMIAKSREGIMSKYWRNYLKD